MTKRIERGRDRGDRSKGNRLGSRSLAATLLACALLPPATAGAEPAPPVELAQADAAVSFSIPAQPLATALDAFSAATGWQVGYAAGLAGGVQSPGLNGRFTPEEALQRLLSGTRIVYRVTGPRTVLLTFDETEASGGLPEDSTLLSPVTVSGLSHSNPADVPFQTPGSSVYISREELDRVPPTSLGDIFKSTSGVISAGNRNGAGLNVNIRGLQGMNRVATLVDGTQQGTATYNGYRGMNSSTFIDPDFIGGVDITKGPTDGAYGAGAMGGVVYLRTLEPGDIVPEGQTYGVRLRTTVGTNAVEPEIGRTEARDESAHPLSGDSYTFNIAGALQQEDYEFILALSKRKLGNYFAGESGGTTMDGVPLSPIEPGDEVFNTSEDSRSLLLKGKAYFGESHWLELGYTYYDNDHGERDDILFVYPGWFPMTQLPLSTTTTNTGTLKYGYLPEDNPLIDLRANIWATHLKNFQNGGEGLDILNPDQTVFTTGAELYNTSLLDTPAGGLTLTYGASYSYEEASGDILYYGGASYRSSTAQGTRLLVGGFGQASLAVTDWLTLGGGLRYDHYRIRQTSDLLKQPHWFNGEPYPDYDGGRLNPSASVTFTPLEGVQVYGLYTEGFRPPALQEASYFSLIPNPDLEPEVAKNYEVGVNLLRDGLLREDDSARLKISYFWNNYHNYIIRNSDTGYSPYFWGNIDKALYYGFEIAGGYDMGFLFFDGSLTRYTKIEYCVDTTGCEPAGRGTDYGANYIPPELAYSFTVGARLFDERLQFGLQTVFSGERSVSATAGGFIPPSLWPESLVFNLFGSYEILDEVLLNVSVENLTNEYYLDPLSISNIPSPGLTARAGLTLSF